MKELKNKILMQGRSITWVAKQIGVSRPFLSLCLDGKRNLPKEKELLIRKILT